MALISDGKGNVVSSGVLKTELMQGAKTALAALSENVLRLKQMNLATPDELDQLANEIEAVADLADGGKPR